MKFVLTPLGLAVRSSGVQSLAPPVSLTFSGLSSCFTHPCSRCTRSLPVAHPYPVFFLAFNFVSRYALHLESPFSIPQDSRETLPPPQGLPCSRPESFFLMIEGGEENEEFTIPSSYSTVYYRCLYVFY